MKSPTLPRHRALALVLLFPPLLQGCSSLPATVAPYGVKALMSVRHSNESAYGYYQFGKYLQGRNQLEAAAGAYEKAMSLDSAYVEARNALGVINSLQQNLDLAIENFRLAAAQAPRSAHVHSNLGHAYYLQKRYSEAIESLQTAAGLEPRNHTTVYNLGLAYQAAGLKEKADDAFRQASLIQTTYASPHFERVVAQHLGTPQALAQTEPSLDVPSANQAGELSRSARSNGSFFEAVFTETGASDLTIRRNDVHPTLALVESNVYELRPAASPPVEPALPPAGSHRSANVVPTKLVRLEVSNANGTPGLAKAVAAQLRRSGFDVVRVTNERPYNRPRTEVEYRDGYTDEARLLALTFKQKGVVVPDESLRADVHVRIVLGHDVGT